MSLGSDIRAGGAFVELYTKNSRLVRGLNAASRRLRAFGATARTIGAQMMRAAAIAGAPLALATRIYAGFADQMAQVRAVTGATKKEFASLTDQAKDLGRTTSFTAAQVAAGMTELGRAGFDASEITAAMPAVLNLARATSTDLARAAEIAAGAMRGFGLEAGDTARIADVLTATANSSAQTLDDIGEAMKMVAPLAAEAGESFEDIAAALGVLANNSIKGTMAGTALARAFKNLSTDAAQKQLDQLGITATDQQGNLRPLAEILTELGQKTKGLGSAQRLSIFESLFGRGEAAALKLAAPGASFEDLQNTIGDSAGAAAKTAKIMDDTIGGSWRKMMSAIEGVAIAVGEGLAPTIRGYADALTAAAGVVTAWVKEHKGLIITAAKVIGVVAGLAAAFMAVGTVGGVLAFVFGGIASIVSAVATAIGVAGAVIAAILSPIGLVVAGIVVFAAELGTLLYVTGAAGKIWTWLKDVLGGLLSAVRETFGAMLNAMMSGKWKLAVQILWTTLKIGWKKGLAYLSDRWHNFFDLMVRGARTAFFAIWRFALNVSRKVIDAVAKIYERLTGRKGWVAALQRQNAEAMKLLDDEQRRPNDRQDAAAARRRKEVQDEIDRLQDQRRKLIDEANGLTQGKAPAKPGEKPDEKPGKKSRLLDWDPKTYAPEHDKIKRGVAAMEVRGTFNASRIAGLAAAGIQDRLVNATEQTAEELKKIRRENLALFAN